MLGLAEGGELGLIGSSLDPPFKENSDALRFDVGVFPGIALYLSRFYRNSELAFRLGLYIVCAPLAGAFGGLLASGILKIDSFHAAERWRNIFFVSTSILPFSRYSCFRFNSKENSPLSHVRIDRGIDHDGHRRWLLLCSL